MNNTNSAVVKVGDSNSNITIHMVEQQKIILQPTIKVAESLLKKQGYRYVTGVVHGPLASGHETQYWIKNLAE